MTDRSGSPIVSHGRGGAGNIEADPHTYTDGSIVREGPAGDQGDGAYSSGRGGAGNINSPRMQATNPTGQPGDSDVVPETATRKDDYANYHTGRGGEGNIHRDHEGKMGLKEKVLNKVSNLGKKDG